MDPVTHAALGIVTAETILGERAPARAALAGLLAGVMPDFDLIATLMAGPLERFTIHRGITHSILFALIMGPLLGYLFSRKGGGGNKPGPAAWSVLCVAAIMSHIIIDCFTTYGTMIFLPFSDYRVAFSSISIVDLFFTVPLLIAAACFLLIRKNKRLGAVILYSGLAFSAVYLAGTTMVKRHVAAVFERELNRQGMAHTRIFTSPTLLTGLLWVGTAEGDTDYYTANYSLLDAGDTINFNRIKKNHELIGAIRTEKPVRKLIWFTDGLYSIEAAEGHLVLNDLRYGTYRLGGRTARPLNSFIITTGDHLQITSRHRHSFDRTALLALLKRMSGEKYGI